MYISDMALFDAYTTPHSGTLCAAAVQPSTFERERLVSRRRQGAEMKNTTDSHHQQQADDKRSGSSARELVPGWLTELIGTDMGRQSRETARRFT